ncbi:MAG: acyl-CoA/acyl-ACP dehydrogenase [Acidimicrobiales bacterium]|nr:acyl-CoA/acyl-ACP dehydrogenase [Acidimicrobiales bacterium]
MDLDLNDEQQMLGDMVREVCADLAPLTRLRELEDDPVGYDAALWAKLAELDLIGLLLPAAYGGSEMSLIEGVVVHTELGRALAPSPLFVSSVVAAGCLVAAGNDEQRQTWLPKVASGEAILSVAWLEPDNGSGPRGVQLRAERDGDDYVLTGTKRHALFASSAQRLVVPVRVGDGDGDIDLLLVDPNADGVTLTQQMTIASDTQYRVDLDGVRVAADDRIGAAGSGWATFAAVLRDAMVLAAAQAVGGARFALDITVEYSKDRVQFDKPLGAFQALSHYMADATTAIDGAEGLVWEAAWAASAGRPEAVKLAPMAKLFACDTFRDTTAMAQQIFGGVGFTLEYDIQLYFRRAKQLQLSWGDAPYLEALIATEVLDAPAA